MHYRQIDRVNVLKYCQFCDEPLRRYITDQYDPVANDMTGIDYYTVTLLRINYYFKKRLTREIRTNVFTYRFHC